MKINSKTASEVIGSKDIDIEHHPLLEKDDLRYFQTLYLRSIDELRADGEVEVGQETIKYKYKDKDGVQRVWDISISLYNHILKENPKLSTKNSRTNPDIFRSAYVTMSRASKKTMTMSIPVVMLYK